jgi:phosphoglycerate kinase
MELKTIENADFNNKKVIVRVDYNVPIDDSGKITDNTRILASLDTIRLLDEKNAKIILISHLGRPEGFDSKLKLDVVAKELQNLLDENKIWLTVTKLNDCIGDEVKRSIDSSGDGRIYLLENLRFHPEEEKNDSMFSSKLASLADNYVSDAFGTVHRAHASTEGISKYLPSFAGLLVEREALSLSNVTENPKKPFIAIIGCAKIKDKLNAVQFLLEKADKVIFGGAIVFSFFKSQGHEIGKSICEKDLSKIDELLKKYRSKIILPKDIVVTDDVKNPTRFFTVDFDKIPQDMIGVDVGTKSIDYFKKELSSAKTVIWNGPMGVFEVDEFAKGTDSLAEYISHMKEKGTFTVIGGGDTVSAVSRFNPDMFSHISTGGGAFLEFIEGKDLPGIKVLKK